QGEAIMGAEEGGDAVGPAAQLAEGGGEMRVLLELQLVDADAVLELGGFPEAEQALHAAAEAGGAVHIGDLAVAEPGEIPADGGTGLVVGGHHLVDPVERGEPA